MAIGVVGSFARGSQRPNSDVDLIVIVDNPFTLLRDLSWVSRFGTLESQVSEDYGLVQSLRCFDDRGGEMEFGIAAPEWCELPIDSATANVIQNGMLIVYDPNDRLRRAAEWVSSM